MEEIILPIDGGDKGEKINPDASEINIAKILSCSKRTIKSYIEKGILPKPVSERDGIYYFSRDAVVEAMGLKNLDEVLVSFEEAIKLLGTTVGYFETLLENKRFTEIKLKGFQSKRFYLKREIDEFDVEIERITKPLPIGKENRLIRILFSAENFELIGSFLTERESDIVKKVYVDKMNYEEIGEYYSITRQRVSEIFERAMSRLERILKNILPIFRRQEERTVFENVVKRIEENYAERFNELEKKISYLNSLIEKAEERIVIPPKLPDVIVPDEFAPHFPDDVRKLLKTKIYEFDFTARLMNCLKAADVETVEEIIQLSERELLQFRNFGIKSLKELKEFLKSNNLALGMNLNEIKEMKKVNYDGFVSDWMDKNKK